MHNLEKNPDKNLFAYVLGGVAVRILSSRKWKKGSLTLLSIMQQYYILFCGLFSVISPSQLQQQNNVKCSFLYADGHTASNCGGTVNRSCCYSTRPHPLFHQLHLPCHPSSHTKCNVPDEAIVERKFPMISWIRGENAAHCDNNAHHLQLPACAHPPKTNDT